MVELDDGRRAILPSSYVERATSLGYALTVFCSQGITVDRTLALAGDALFQEAGYTQLSRGRLSNRLYVAAPENPRWEVGHLTSDLDQRDALESLAAALFQSREQMMAQDLVPRWPTVTPGDLDAAFKEHATLDHTLAENAPEDITSRLEGARLRLFDKSRSEPVAPGATKHLADLLAAQCQREAWIADHRQEIEAWPRLDLRRLEYRLGQSASYDQPDHTTALLGPLPDAIAGIERWQRAAGAIAAYRIWWGIDAADALGPLPLEPEQRAHWGRATGIIASAGFDLPGGAGDGVEETWLSSLWNRIEALDAAWSKAVGSERDRDVAAPPPFSWSHERDTGPDLAQGFGR